MRVPAPVVGPEARADRSLPCAGEPLCAGECRNPASAYPETHLSK